AQPERCALAPGGTLEVRLQGRQIDCEDPFHRQGTAHLMDEGRPDRVRLLFQCEPGSRSSALEPGQGAPYRRDTQTPDADVQRLRRPSGQSLQRHESENPLLMSLKQVSPHNIAVIKTALFILCLLPLAWLLAAFCADALFINPLGLPDELLGANPVETVIRDLGTWALRFLLLTLCITPLRKLTGMHWLLRLRRMLGLFAFFYALLHFNIYLGLDQSYDWSEIAKDILKRPFITIGMLTFTLMLPLALTSN